MTTVVTRLYSDAEKANAAIEALKEEGFGALDYTVVAANDGEAQAKLTSAGVVRKDAPVFAGSVGAGNTAVVVRAPFGAAATAAFVLDHFGPITISGARGNLMVPDSYRRKYRLSGVSFSNGPLAPTVVRWNYTPGEDAFFLPTLISPPKNVGLKKPKPGILPELMKQGPIGKLTQVIPFTRKVTVY